MVASKQISVGAGRQVLDKLVADGGEPARDRRGRGSCRDRRRGRARRCRRGGAGRRTPTPPQRVREGNAKAIGPIVGYVMRETKGRADGTEVARLVHEQLGSLEDRRATHFGRRAKGKLRARRQYAHHEPVSSQLKRFITSAVHPAARGAARCSARRTAYPTLPAHERGAGYGAPARGDQQRRSRNGEDRPRARSAGSHVVIPPQRPTPASLGRRHGGAAGQG